MSEPIIVPRSVWGARAPRARVPVSWPDGVTLWVHHSDGPIPAATATIAQESAIVRGIQNFHMNNPDRRWNDVGYGYLGFPSGRLYEGRGEAVAAHCPGHNHEPSICMVGTYSTVAPADALHVAVYRLADLLRAGDLAGHRQGFSTSCPGDAGMAKVVNGPPPKGFGADFDPEDVLTLRQRLRTVRPAFGPATVDLILRRLAEGYVGDVPNPTDRRTFRSLRDAGFGVVSSRAIVKTMRRKLP